LFIRLVHAKAYALDLSNIHFQRFLRSPQVKAKVTHFQVSSLYE